MEELEKVVRTLPTKPSKPIEDAKMFLRDTLRNGPRLVAEVVQLAAKSGVAERTLRRAKQALSVETIKLPVPGRGPIAHWRLT